MPPEDNHIERDAPPLRHSFDLPPRHCEGLFVLKRPEAISREAALHAELIAGGHADSLLIIDDKAGRQEAAARGELVLAPDLV
jgi:hypothetical protein